MSNVGFIKSNQNRGFDQLSEDLGISKSVVKNLWNQLELGFKYIPRTQIELRQSFNGLYSVLSPIVVYLNLYCPMVIPEGFYTDLGSIPKWLRWLVDKDDPHFLIAFVLHDVMYVEQSMSRIAVDALMFQNARRLGAPLWQATLVYLAVRLFGWYAWYKNKRDDKKRSAVIALVAAASKAYADKQKDFDPVSVI